MNFIQNLKQVARDIIELSETMANTVHTWEQQATKVKADYKDRAGFLSYSDIELCADVFLEDDQPTGLLRARLAYAPGNLDIFTIITLHFDTNRVKATEIISKRKTVSQQTLIELLNEKTTTPLLIHVSLKSEPKGVGKRLEYSTDQIETLSNEDQTTFIKILHEAFSYITKEPSSKN